MDRETIKERMIGGNGAWKRFDNDEVLESYQYMPFPAWPMNCSRRILLSYPHVRIRARAIPTCEVCFLSNILECC